VTRRGSKESMESSSSESSSGEEEAEGAGEGAGEAGADEARETHAAAEISALVNYVQPVHFSSFESAEKKNRFYEMSSFDEKQATTLLKERPIEFVNYNKHQLSRVYPAGTRFDSSNFMPQTLDLAMQLNLGTFEYNKRCGYLLKPEFMRRKDRRLDPFAESTVDGIIAGSLTITVLSAQLLTDKRCGTYVEVDMYGLPADTVRKKFRTRVAPNNGINPVVLPELAMIRVAAHEESGRLLGHRVLPVVGLCPGYRHVNLRTELGQPLPASVLLQVVVKDYVPDGLSEWAEALANPIKYQSELDKREHQLAVLTEDTDAPPAPATLPPYTVAHAPTPPSADMLPVPNPIKYQSELDKREHQLAVLTEDTEAPPAPATLPPYTVAHVVREKRTELARKLDALRRKYDKERRPTSANYSSSEGGAHAHAHEEGGGAAAPERELRLRYHHAIYAALDKHVRTDQQHQMKSLTPPRPTLVPAPERELRLRYHHAIYAALDKHVRTDQQHQMKSLTVSTAPPANPRAGARARAAAALPPRHLRRARQARAHGPAAQDEVSHLPPATLAPAPERELRLRYHHAIYAALDKHVRTDQQHQVMSLTVSTAPPPTLVAVPERELRLRYHHAIYAALDKHVRTDQQHQMKSLTVGTAPPGYPRAGARARAAAALPPRHLRRAGQAPNSRKEDVKALAKKANRDKDEILRIKREIHSQSVERGVAECCRLEQNYARRREQLARSHERLLTLLQKHRDQESVILTPKETRRDTDPTPRPTAVFYVRNLTSLVLDRDLCGSDASHCMVT
ncbi:Phosphoinositide phospholipase C, partial [Operophtera brumata]